MEKTLVEFALECKNNAETFAAFKDALKSKDAGKLTEFFQKRQVTVTTEEIDHMLMDQNAGEIDVLMY